VQLAQAFEVEGVEVPRLTVIRHLRHRPPQLRHLTLTRSIIVASCIRSRVRLPGGTSIILGFVIFVLRLSGIIIARRVSENRHMIWNWEIPRRPCSVVTELPRVLLLLAPLGELRDKGIEMNTFPPPRPPHNLPLSIRQSLFQEQRVYHIKQIVVLCQNGIDLRIIIRQLLQLNPPHPHWRTAQHRQSRKRHIAQPRVWCHQRR